MWQYRHKGAHARMAEVLLTGEAADADTLLCVGRLRSRGMLIACGVN